MINLIADFWLTIFNFRYTRPVKSTGLYLLSQKSTIKNRYPRALLELEKVKKIDNAKITVTIATSKGHYSHKLEAHAKKILSK